MVKYFAIGNGLLHFNYRVAILILIVLLVALLNSCFLTELSGARSALRRFPAIFFRSYQAIFTLLLTKPQAN